MERAVVSPHQPHERFGPFLIVRAIGRGGMGEVYVARTPWDASPVAAVKRLRPDVARIPTFAERFRHEAELAVRLHHPNLVATLDVGTVNEQVYVASELVLGKDTGHIADRLRERGQGAPLAVVIRLLADVLEGLAYVHGARNSDGEWLRLVHRDVTPGNVLVGYDGIARLADFGLAKSSLTETSQLTNHGEILGTPHYLAPEVIRGEPSTPASDLYGLGAVMYRILTGVAPHQGTTAEVLAKALSEKPRSLAELRPDLPSWFVGFVHAMLETDVPRRPKDAGELATDLTRRAKRANLLLQHASVGRWLGALFEVEREEEEEEHDRLCQIDPDASAVPMQGTVVLATAMAADPVAGGRIEAPPERPDSFTDGTELDLDEQKRAARELASDDAMPTRAFALPEGSRSPPPPRRQTEPSGANLTIQGEGDSIALELDTHLQVEPAESGEHTREDDSLLPGFVDTGGSGPAEAPRPRTGRVRATSLEAPRSTSVASAPAGFREDAKPRSDTPTPAAPRRRSTPVAAAARVEPVRRNQETPKSVPAIAAPSRPGKAVAPPPAIVESRRGRAPGPSRPEPERAVWPWVLATVVALAVGLAGGFVLGGAERPDPNAAIRRGLQLRYRAARVRIEAKRSSGGTPAAAEVLAADAADALALDDLSRASARITELEGLITP